MQTTVLIISQVYVPDPAAVGQYLHDVARELVERGVRVVVLASAWGHHNANVRYASREHVDGVEIRRFPFSDFGKKNLAIRAAGAVGFLLQASAYALKLGSVDHVLVSTSPPFAASFGLSVARRLKAKTTFWAMDINPDQAIALGAVSPSSIPARLSELGLRAVLAGANNVVVLDDYMKRRLAQRLAIEHKTRVIPPWPLFEVEQGDVAHVDNPFRAEQGLEGKFVVMYSGNITNVHPLTTLLEAAYRLKGNERLEFVVVGDGTARPGLERWLYEHPSARVRLLPYRSRGELRFSLAAADLHVVVMGEGQVGIVHPSKVYGILAVARPFMFFGPERSHLGDIVERGVGRRVAHGDVDGAVRLLSAFAAMPHDAWQRECASARRLLDAEFSRERWQSAFCDLFV